MERVKKDFFNKFPFKADERDFFEKNSICKELKRKEFINLREIKGNLYFVIEGIVQIDEMLINGENVQITFLGEKNFFHASSMINPK